MNEDGNPASEDKEYSKARVFSMQSGPATFCQHLLCTRHFATCLNAGSSFNDQC